MPVVASLAEPSTPGSVNGILRDERRRIGQKISTVAQDLPPIEHLRAAAEGSVRPGPGASTCGSTGPPDGAAGEVPVPVRSSAANSASRCARLEPRLPYSVAGRSWPGMSGSFERYGQAVHLDHYLEVLQHKPGALGGSTALAHARNTGASSLGCMRGSGRNRGRSTVMQPATRELIDVLLLHRTMPTPAVLAGISAALTVGAVTADVVPKKPRGGPLRKLTSRSSRRRRCRRWCRSHNVVSPDPAAVIAGLPARQPAPPVRRRLRRIADQESRETRGYRIHE